MAQSTKPNILVIWGDDIGIWRLQFVLVGRSVTCFCVRREPF
jgi:arylsulfatase A-like enzyme